MFKKIILSIGIFLSIFTISACTNKSNKSNVINKNMDEYIDSMIDKTTSYTPSWNQESFKGKWNYIDGVFLKSIIDKYKLTNNNKYMDFVVKYVNYYIDEDGNFININNYNLSGFTYGELDTICESRILFDLLDYTNDSRYEKAITETFEALMDMPICENTKNYYHKSTYPNQIWLDGMYMYAPFLTRYAIKYDRESLIKDLVDQYKYIRNNMFNEDKGLYYHALDVSKEIFWADSETGLSKSFWLRSCGWLIASLADVLEYLNNDKYNNYYKELNEMFEEAIEGILQYLDTDYNMFYQVVDRKGEGALISYEKYLKYLNKDYTADTYIENYLESSGSSLIAYSLLKNYKNKNEEYYNLGLNIYEGVYNHSFKDNSLNDICITAGLGPESRLYRDSTFEYYLAERVGSNDAKGVGPFIMAYIAK